MVENTDSNTSYLATSLEMENMERECQICENKIQELESKNSSAKERLDIVHEKIHTLEKSSRDYIVWLRQQITECERDIEFLNDAVARVQA
jgi:predicted  nucleic acid-binding Zn-ribbon protein